jgi:hypothetical protein
MNPLAVLFLALCVLGDGIWNWTWDRVPDLDVVSYRVEVAERIPYFYDCVDEEGNPAECVEYPPWSSLVWTVEDTVLQVPEIATGFGLCSTWDEDGISGVVVPAGRDALIYVNVRAVDSSGNVGN